MENSTITAKKTSPSSKDLTYGTDCRGDYALFIDTNHFVGVGGRLDKKTKKFLSKTTGWTFFRLIEDEKELSSHGYIENGKIVQWG